MHIPQIEAVKPAFVTDYLDDDPIMIAYSEEETQPLPTLPKRSEEHWCCAAILLFCLSFVGVALWNALTYPTVTVDLVPVEQSVSITTTLAVPQRQLAPITLTASLSTLTTGRGHHNAQQARGRLTFYNGQYTSVVISAGTVITGADHTQVITEAPAGEVHTACCAVSVFVKSSQAFSGGANARDFQAVAPSDVADLTGHLKQALSQQMEEAFALAPGEGLFLTTCGFTPSANHQVGEEADTVTVTLTSSCHGIAYDRQVLETQATAALKRQEASTPGRPSLLVGRVQTSILRVSPWRVQCEGVWAYALTPAYQHDLASQLAGETPQQAKAALLHTGVIQQVIIPTRSALPQDPDYIRFRVWVGREASKTATL